MFKKKYQKGFKSRSGHALLTAITTLLVTSGLLIIVLTGYKRQMQSYQQLSNFYEARILATLLSAQSKRRIVSSKGQALKLQDGQIQVQLINGYQTQFSSKKYNS